MHRNRILLALLALAALLAAGCGKKGDKIVAEVGPSKISAGQLLIEYNAISPPARPDFATLEQKKAFLDVLVSKQILSSEAKARGLDKDPSIDKGLRAFEEGELIKAIFTEKGSKTVTIEPTEVESYYKDTATEVHLRDIWTGQDKAAADGALKEIRAGGDFSAVAKKVSKNEYAVEGGDMGWMPRSSVQIALFAQQIAGLKPGDVSDVLATPAGYHIVQLVEEKAPDMAEFEKQKMSLRNDLRKKKEAKAWQAYVGQLRTDAKMATPDENVALVRQRWGQAPAGSLPEFSDQEKALPLVTYNGGTWTIGDFLFFIQSAGPTFRPNFADTSVDLSTWAKNRALSEVIVKSARGLGLDKSSDLVARVARKREEMMLDLLHQDLVKDVTANDDDIKAYYEAHKDSLHTPNGATVRYVMTSTQARIDSAYAEVQAGKPFEQVVKRFSEDSTTVRKGGLLDTLMAGSTGRPDLDEAIFALEPGQYTKPFTIGPTSLFVFEMVKKWQGRPLTLDETKSSIAAYVKTLKQNKSFDAWMEEKRKSLNVKVNDDALNAIVAEETGNAKTE